MTRLKWFRSTQPLPEDAPADRQIGARKVRMVASLHKHRYRAGTRKVDSEEIHTPPMSCDVIRV